MHNDRTAEKAFWNDRYSRDPRAPSKPSGFLVKYEHLLPGQGIALDIACGTGDNAMFLARQLNVVGIDISDVAINIAKKKVSIAGMESRITFIVDDSRDALERGESSQYDIVASIDYFEPDIVPSMKRVLKPGGTVIIQAYTTNDEHLGASKRMKDKLVTEESFFEPGMFGGFWILVHEIDDFGDIKNRKRQRVNMIARKPFT